MQHRVATTSSALGLLRRRQLVRLAQQAAGATLLGSPSLVIRHTPTIVDIVCWSSMVLPSGEVLVGDLPSRALKLVAEWAALHRRELEADWSRAKGGGTPEPIDPLP
jgi:hypothetical protein